MIHDRINSKYIDCSKLTMDTIVAKDYYIASLDILGGKKLIFQDKNNKHLNAIKNIYTSWISINKGSSNVFPLLKFKIFSDNIILDIDAECKDGLDYLLEFAADLANHFLTSEYKPRGGICKGPLYIDDTFVRGSGLVEAYEMESETAIYPRIILTSDIVNFASKRVSDAMIFYDANHDGWTYLNYLRAFGRNRQRWVDDISMAKEILNKEIKAEKAEKIIDKLEWLQEFIDTNLNYWESKC